MLLAGLLTACSTYQPDLCTFVNFDTAQCSPTDPGKPSYDINVNDMIGYTCFSPEDFSEGKKRVRKVLENLD